MLDFILFFAVGTNRNAKIIFLVVYTIDVYQSLTTSTSEKKSIQCDYLSCD